MNIVNIILNSGYWPIRVTDNPHECSSQRKLVFSQNGIEIYYTKDRFSSILLVVGMDWEKSHEMICDLEQSMPDMEEEEEFANEEFGKVVTFSPGDGSYFLGHVIKEESNAENLVQTVLLKNNTIVKRTMVGERMVSWNTIAKI